MNTSKPATVIVQEIPCGITINCIVDSKFFPTLLLILVLLLTAARNVAAEELEKAPVNPDFADFMERRANIATDNNTAFGWIPAPVSITDRLEKKRPVARTTASAPAAYDLRSLSRVTPVKNQNPWGTCWAFATYASMESGLLPGEIRDLSEKNMVNLHGFDYREDDGGHGFMSMAYLCGWVGPVDESDDPYPSESWSSSPSEVAIQKHTQQVLVIPGKISATDNAAIKQIVMDHGAMYVSFYYDAEYYNSTHSTYYYTGSSAKNHAVVIVGWDDEFDRTKFSTTAPANGAYIVKNSWGTEWGDNGFFYVSYYDTKFSSGDMFCFLNAETTDNYNTIYQHDPLGWISSLNSPWAAAIYTAVSTETLQAVGFYTDAVTTSYSLFAYTGVSAGAPRSGTLACSMTGSISNSGFHTLTLTTPTIITEGELFSVVLHLDGTSCYPQAVEDFISGHSSAATAGTDETYYSFDGSSFTDLITYNSTANFCLKAYTTSSTSDDNDGDRIPDWWEILYFGSPANCIATNDVDGDGQNNREEYICGMDPTNATSCFMITDCGTPSGEDCFVIEWNAVSGRVYYSQWSTNLILGFNPLSSGIEFPCNACTDAAHSAEDTCFYQVKVELQ